MNKCDDYKGHARDAETGQKAEKENREKEKQRTIGQQLMLTRLLIAEDKKSDQGLPCFIRTSEIAMWMDEKEQKVDSFISDCFSVTPYRASQEAAKLFCKDKYQVDIGYVFRTMFHYGSKAVRAFLKGEPYDYDSGFLKNWEEFLEIQDYQGPDESIIYVEGFKAILDCYREYYIGRAQRLIDLGYDPDVICLMTHGIGALLNDEGDFGDKANMVEETEEADGEDETEMCQSMKDYTRKISIIGMIKALRWTGKTPEQIIELG